MFFYTYNYYHDCIHMLSSANTEAARPSHLPIGGVPWYVQDMYAPTMAPSLCLSVVRAHV